MSAHTCDESEVFAEDCRACVAAYAKEEAYHRSRYHPALRPLALTRGLHAGAGKAGRVSARRLAWNSTLPAPEHEIKRTGRLRNRGKPRHAVSGKRDEPYREHVRGLPCILIGLAEHRCRGGVEACHVKSRGAGGTDRGNLLPICSRGHSESHTIGRFTFERKYGFELAAVAKQIECAFVLRDFGGLSGSAGERTHE
jgi:hypothetical protein